MVTYDPFNWRSTLTKNEIMERLKDLLQKEEKRWEEYELLDEDGNRYFNAVKHHNESIIPIKTELYLLEHNIKYTYQRWTFKIGKYIYFPNTYKWGVDGKNKYYCSKGIEDFIKRFYGRTYEQWRNQNKIGRK